MSPFSTTIMRSNPRQALLILLIPLLGFGLLLALHFNNSPKSTFKKYQAAITYKNWETAVSLSDQNTRSYLKSLDSWVWSGRLEDINRLDPFQQFLIYVTRCRILSEGRARPTEAEMFGIWMEALYVNKMIIQSRVINLYNFGNKYVGQLYLNSLNLASGKQIRFTDEGNWKVETMPLLQENYEAASLEGNLALLRNILPDYFAQGFSKQHLMSLKFHLESMRSGAEDPAPTVLP